MLRIPKVLYSMFKNLLRFTPEQARLFINELNKNKLTVSFSELGKEIGDKIKLDPNIVKDVLEIISDFYEICEDYNVPVEEFIEDIEKGLKAIDEADFIPENYDWALFKDMWKKFLSNTDFIGMKAKAKGLLTTQEKIYHSSRMITDFRPVYYYGKIQKEPEYGVVIHTFKIEYVENNKRKKIHLFLDKKDLEDLYEIIDRELKKDDSFKRLLNNKDIKLINID